MPRLTAPAFHLDTRVADSPIVGMRFLLDSRASDLGQVTEALSGVAADLVERRSQLRQRLRDVDERFRDQLAAMPLRRRRLEAGAAAQMDLCAELEVVEEKLTSCRERSDELREETAVLHRLSAALVPLAEGLSGTVDDDSRRYSVAARELLALVDDDQQQVINAVLEGPVQSLTDAVACLELAGRLFEDGDGDQAVAELAGSFSALARSHRQSGRTVRRLRPPLPAEGLVAVLRGELAGVQGPRTRFDVVGNPRALAGTLDLTVLRIATEAIDNAVRHSRAAHLEIVLSYHRERTVLVVRDDGDGFDIPATEARLGRTHWMGLISMRERASLEGGVLELRSLPGMGTEVRASFSH